MKQRVVAIVQARMSSTRLPGKVLKEILGRPILSYLIERIRYVRSIDDIVVATTTDFIDNAIVDFCISNNIKYFRGSVNDVLLRFFETAISNHADFIVRICSDSPIIDTNLMNDIIAEFVENSIHCDYLSNTIDQTYPLGMNIEIFSLEALKIANHNATTTYEREHVTPYIYFNKERFRIVNKKYQKNYSHIRLTIDEQDDFIMMKHIIENLYPMYKYFSLEQILKFLEDNPEILRINQNVKQTPKFKSI
jgi:spore coat polysaccharide biosynthesis protein SpsF